MSEIIVAVRKAVGADFCLGSRINGDEFTLGGNTLADSRADRRCAAAKLGLDYISVSVGGKFEDAVPKEGEVARSLHRLLRHPHHAALLDAGAGQHLPGRRHQAHAQRRRLHHPGHRRRPHPHGRTWPKTSCRRATWT